MRHEPPVFLTIFGVLLLVMSPAISAFSSAGATQPPPGSVQLSHVRIVRLSFTEGTVTMRRPGSSAWTDAEVNDPVQEGFSLSTSKNSFAEVQFENGSTVRLGGLTEIDFTQLALTPEGGHINHLTLDEGYASFHIDPGRRDEYRLNVSGLSLMPRGKTKFRTDFIQNRLRVEVFDGHVQASGSNLAETLAKNHALVRDDPNAAFQLSDRVPKDAWDKWDDAREQQSTLAFNDEAVAPSSPLYGWDDLDVYGDWSYYPGYGEAWAPYEPLGWSPYSAGMWDWYGGLGYTWISAEPWGWLPFHSGFWNFNAGMGWFWMPGSSQAWTPALVNWYSGPGWIGWTPVGAGGIGAAAPCTLAVAGCLTAVRPGVLASAGPIRPGSPNVLHPALNNAITAVAQPNVLSVRNGQQVASGGTRGPQSTPAIFGFTRGPEGAPSSVIMGRQVGVQAVGHHSVLGSVFSGSTPVRVRLGGTMGGKFPIGAGAGRGRSMIAGRESFDASRPGGPQILTRSMNGSASRAAGVFGPGSASSGIARGGRASPGSPSGGSYGGGSHGGGSSSSGHSGGGGGK